jgi:pimeloyl-ACP methyl ester carboxylesterase
MVGGISLFYRETGDPTNPKLLLLHGFPSSSHQYRNHISALANRFHIISPDYPGFGNSDMPDGSKFVYTFDRLAEFVEGLLKQIGFTQFGLYVQDYGVPIGFRIINRHPDWLDWLIIQNSNAYEVGFTKARDGFRN